MTARRRTAAPRPNRTHSPHRAGGPGLTFRYAFRFTDKVAGAATFRCRLDGAPFKRCTSPMVYRHLRRGRHVVRVRSVDAAGTESAIRTVRFVAGGRQRP